MNLVNSRLEILFGNQLLSGLSFRPKSNLLNDSQWHTVTFLRVQSRWIDVVTYITNWLSRNFFTNIEYECMYFSLEVFIDGNEAGSIPFGGLFPLGTLSSDINIGGLSPTSRELVLPGLPTEGFKGHIDHLYIVGKLFDFSKSLDSNFVNLDICKYDKDCQNQTDVCMFSESSYAEYGEPESINLQRIVAINDKIIAVTNLVSSIMYVYDWWNCCRSWKIWTKLCVGFSVEDSSLHCITLIPLL